ncbi:MAG TPA: hypothetical protein DCZ94_17240 [Lentisphaeria bacterium]|nr:MAG: hypothetical protein A2X48_20940 [Lentisphaerae bacterium GWF2_49_21]HBC88690.1 hypothetical protein [Lentisphaeria bacterium]
MKNRPFSPDSFWNTPIPANPEIDDKSESFIKLLGTTVSEKRAVYVNSTKWTIPVYWVRSSQVPMVQVFPLKVRDSHRGFAPNFDGWAPIPPEAKPDSEEDSHMCIIDEDKDIVYDFFCIRYKDGKILTRSAITYPLYGSGVFDKIPFKFEPGTSVHDYGPCRAAGTALLGGLVLQEEITSGKIEHKIALATDLNEHQKFVFPAIWTDGFTQGGLPEGAVVQLDPKLNLDKFDLCPAARTLAVAMQKYGMVNVDVAGGICIYVENLNFNSKKNWKGIIDSGWILEKLGLEHLRVIKIKDLRDGGLKRTKHVWNQKPPAPDNNINSAASIGNSKN